MADKSIEAILEILENSYAGARAVDALASMTRLSRAIAAIKAPVGMEIFTKEFKEWYNQHETTSE